jgi:hypothetical protein
MNRTLLWLLLPLLASALLLSCSSSADKGGDWWSRRQAAEKQQAEQPPPGEKQPAPKAEPPAEPAQVETPQAELRRPNQEIQQAQGPPAPEQPPPAMAAKAEAPPAAPPPPPAPLAVQEAQPEPPQEAGIPYEKAFPEAFEKVQPVRIGVLSSPQGPAAGDQIALILTNFQRKRLERALGASVEVAFVSRSNKKHKRKTHIRYRPNFLKAAIQVATVIPREQVVEPMTEQELQREEVDMFIYVGTSVR